MKLRNIPMRKDIITSEMMPKDNLLRIVKTPDNEIKIDTSGKMNGRGAYISINVKNSKLAKKKHVFNKIFKLNIQDEFYDELIEYIEHIIARRELFNE